MNAAVIESWVELSRWMEWAQGAKPTIQDTIEQINKRESDFENRSEFRFSIFEKRAGIDALRQARRQLPCLRSARINPTMAAPS
jgi:hypothetical protein